jgi:hypothetical protein
MERLDQIEKKTKEQSRMKLRSVALSFCIGEGCYDLCMQSAEPMISQNKLGSCSNYTSLSP